MPEKLLTPQEVAEKLRVTVPWVMRMARTYHDGDDRSLPALKLGRYWRFRETDVDEWIARRKQERENGRRPRRSG